MNPLEKVSGISLDELFAESGHSFARFFVRM